MRDVRLKCLKTRVQLCQLFRDDDDELITADAIHPATRCKTPLHRLGRRTDQLIARRMSTRIIDLLEPVHIHRQISPGRMQIELRDIRLIRVPVSAARKLIRHRNIAQLLLLVLLLHNLREHIHHAA